uniref:Si:ch211-165b10.3 n=1 Tax=Cyprinus carpio TaxID=7962 RepID=A0A8C2KJR2_CYPCA
MGLYRNIVWFIKGMREYTRSGFENATAMAIDKKGVLQWHCLYCLPKQERTRGEIISASGNTEVYIHVLDLFETRKVWEFAEAFKKEHSSLNVLINNAGCMKNFTALKKCLKTTQFVSNDDDLLLNTRYVSLCARPQRQQVVMTEVWAKANPKIHFSVMHPGWTDTPAVAKVMPQFHQMMRDRLRSAEQGANTVTTALPSGLFFQDRRPVSAHLPLAWTHSSRRDVKAFMGRLENLAMAVKPPD